MNMLTERTVIHYPDLYFAQYCINNFDINRGIYNVIDRWFFEKNFFNVIERRKVIIEFLIYINEENTTNQRIKFGKGGVSDSLTNFWECIHYSGQYSLKRECF
ncbi:hypothetical protein [Bacillus sp. FJAT-50079]|uniref:hypothetical protein n=1 Tax=Bacillus sp. FJAT-50079 TaxID=2833577 RepID=UPI001BC9D21B|nr:hypothetical protein [Bacillus sp. FJAT-50079]MBS4206625.1 hypothetical protein [Bacillus sp. FJAT-50079]